MSVLLALLVGIVGVLPMLLSRRPKPAFAGILAAAYTLVGWPIIFLGLPGTVFPLFGGFGILTLLWWILTAFIHAFAAKNNDYDDTNPTTASLFPLVLIVVYIGIAFFNSALFRNGDFARLIGETETREWTQDVQPKDPKHVRLVPHELAAWLATKQLGSIPGVVGSQFQTNSDDLTLQRIKDELWYVAPLDFKGFRAWTAAKMSPGYVMVHGEDPRRTPVVVSGLAMAYTRHASLGNNLKRHLWRHGYIGTGLMDYSFEIDEEGKAWYVVTTYRPTIGWHARRVTGIALIDPVSGDIHQYSKEDAPAWIDRVVPDDIIHDYIAKHGQWRGGWWNGVWKHHNIFEPETPTINYGNDGTIYWVTSVTSPNKNDEAMIGLYYTNVHTGRSVFYHTTGGTEAAVLTAVNNTIGYKQWHGAGPVLYNVYGTMASIVPVLGNNQTFQGVAIVNQASLKVSFAETEYEVYRLYQRDLELAGQSIAPENFHDFLVGEGHITRFASDVQGGTTVYYFLTDGSSHIFMGGSERSLEIPLTIVGDQVTFTYDESTEEVVPILSFDNVSLAPPSTLQRELRERVTARQTEMSTDRQVRAAKDALQKMTDEELLELMKRRNNKE